jgi:hypothetical protein
MRSSIWGGMAALILSLTACGVPVANTAVVPAYDAVCVDPSTSLRVDDSWCSDAPTTYVASGSSIVFVDHHHAGWYYYDTRSTVVVAEEHYELLEELWQHHDQQHHHQPWWSRSPGRQGVHGRGQALTDSHHHPRWLRREDHRAHHEDRRALFHEEEPLMIETPELNKRSEVLELASKLGEFLDWLEEQGVHLAKYLPVLDPPVRYSVVLCGREEGCWRVHDQHSLSTTGLMPSHYAFEDEAQEVVAELEQERRRYAEENPRFQPYTPHKEQLLADYFQIDLNKIEKERRALLDELRKSHS